MEKEQKRLKLHTFEGLFTGLAAKFLVKDEKDPVKRTALAREMLNRMSKGALFAAGYAAAGLLLGGAEAFGGVTPVWLRAFIHLRSLSARGHHRRRGRRPAAQKKCCCR